MRNHNAAPETLIERTDHCGQCANWSLPPNGDISKHGFGQCVHKHHHWTSSRTALCVFTPSRFVAKEAA